MNALAHALRRSPRTIDAPTARAAVADMTFELVPLTSLESSFAELPPGARVSVTASPTRTLTETLDVCARVVDLGHRAVPHLAARMIDDADHLHRIIRRCRDLGLTEVFCIAGDADQPGPYPDAVRLLRALLDAAAGELITVGVAGYPDGHAFIDRDELRDALLEKQRLLAEAGVAGHTTTQMCFSPPTIRGWVASERAAGLELPVHLGVPGVVDPAKLMSMGLRLGVGASLQYLRKNLHGLARLLAAPGYDPGDLVAPLADDFEPLGIAGIHAFTFNRVAATVRWQQTTIGGADRGRVRAR